MKSYFAVFLCLLAIVVNLPHATATTNGFIHERTRTALPSFRGLRDVLPETPRYSRYHAVCRSVYDGTELPCVLQVELGQSDEKGDRYDGGHRHGGDGVPRPMTYPADTSPVLRVDGVDRLPNESLAAEIVTNESGPIYWAHPEIAGTQQLSAVLHSAPGWYCLWQCYTRTTRRFEVELRIGYEGLERLPPVGEHHITARGADASSDRHPEGQYGQSETIDTVLMLSSYYYQLRGGVRLSINDISLPKGGVFDYLSGQRWSPPHQLHQWGTDVDINRTDESGLKRNCDENTELHQALADVNDTRDSAGRSNAEFTHYCWNKGSSLYGHIHLFSKGLSYAPHE